MKKSLFILLASLFVCVCVIAFISFLSSSPKKEKSQDILPLPTGISLPNRVLTPHIPTITQTQADLDSFLSSLPLKKTIVLSDGEEITYAISQLQTESSRVLHVDISPINYGVAKDSKTCVDAMQKVSSDPINLRFWCDYTWHKTHFIQAVQYIYTSMLSSQLEPSSFSFVWSDKAELQDRALEWAKDVSY